MKFYYVHLHAIELFQNEDKTWRLDSALADTLNASNGFCGFGEIIKLLKSDPSLLVTLKKIDSVESGPNYLTATADVDSTPELYRAYFNGKPGIDHLAAFEGIHLVASEHGLKLLRENGVKKAEADLIDVNIEAYFNENRHYFWMPEPMRTRFIQKFAKSNLR